MAKTTIIFAVLLIALGIIGYSGAGSTAKSSEASPEPSAEASAGKKSVTALIPSFFGGGLLVCGALALREPLRKHAMHGAAMIGMLGLIAGGGRGAMGLGKFFSGDPSLNQRSFLFVWLMAILCGLFVFLCVQSFIAARRAKAQGESAE